MDDLHEFSYKYEIGENANNLIKGQKGLRQPSVQLKSDEYFPDLLKITRQLEKIGIRQI